MVFVAVLGTGIRAESGWVLHRKAAPALPVVRARARLYARGLVATGALGGHAGSPGRGEDPPGYQLYDA